MEKLACWVWLSKLNISSKARSAVIHDFGSAEEAFFSPGGSFRKRCGISAAEAELLEDRSLRDAETVLRSCERQGLEVIPQSSPLYPEKLRQTGTPPCVLYVKGFVLPLDEMPVISVIGTRRASPYGIKMGGRLAYEISRCGGTVVTLLNSGVDEAAARGALYSDRPCIGVLGTAHEACRYPLAKEIAATGMLISEYPPGTRSQRHFFRERNRVAAGVSDGVVVVEAPEKSGTRLFAAEAAELGRDVYAVPGNADAENAAGTLTLLKNGARLVTAGREVMEDYVSRYPGLVYLVDETASVETGLDSGSRRRTDSLPTVSDSADEIEKRDNAPEERKPDAGKVKRLSGDGQRPGQKEIQDRQRPTSFEVGTKNYKQQLAELTEDQLKIIAAIDPGSTHIDDITERTGLTTARVLAQLTVLEIKGFVSRETGRRFSLKIKTEK